MDGDPEKKINILASGHSDGRFGAIVGNYLNQTPFHNLILINQKIFYYLNMELNLIVQIG